MCFAFATYPLYVPNFRLNVVMIEQVTSTSDDKSTPQVALKRVVFPSLSAVGYVAALP